MKKLSYLITLILIFIPALLLAEVSTVEEIDVKEEAIIEEIPAKGKVEDKKPAKEQIEIIEKEIKVENAKPVAKKTPKAKGVAAKKTAKDAPEEVNVEDIKTESTGAPGEVKEAKVSVHVNKDVKLAPSYSPLPREGSFRAGIIGPGIYAGNKTINAEMGIGLEGEYFFFERLSAGLRAMLSTDFQSNEKINTILSFVPQVRYFFDFANHPRWTVYVQGGAGIALLDAKHPAADIAIPGGGFSWNYNERFSIGLDTNLHVLIRSGTTAVAVFAGPTFRYQF